MLLRRHLDLGQLLDPLGAHQKICYIRMTYYGQEGDYQCCRAVQCTVSSGVVEQILVQNSVGLVLFVVTLRNFRRLGVRNDIGREERLLV